MWGNTALLCACAYGKAAAAELLLTRGAAWNIRATMA